MKRLEGISLLGFLLSLAAVVHGQSADAPRESVALLRASSPASVLFDDPDGSALWARGKSYKAKFDASGASYIPFLGSHVPRNFPFALRLSSVRVGGEELSFQRDAAPERVGRTVTYDRGSLHELFDLELESMQQSFLFEELPGSGELVLRIAVETELERTAESEGITFGSEWGGVRYGQAMAFGASGLVSASPVSWVDGALEIRIDGDFLARAARPILIDPLISTFPIDVGPATDYDPDVVYDGSLGIYAVCWTRVFSGLDEDIHVNLLDAQGNLLRELGLDFTTASANRAQAAGIDAVDQFLIAGFWHTVGARGRLIDLGVGTVVVGPVFDLFGTILGDGDYQIGGDAGTTPPFRYCAATAHGQPSPDIMYEILDTSGNSVYLNVLGDGEWYWSDPKLAKVAVGPSPGSRTWAISFRVLPYSIYHQLRSALIRQDGIVTHDVLIGTESSQHDLDPLAVGAQLEGAVADQAHLVIWRHTPASGQSEIRALPIRGGTPVSAALQIGLDPNLTYTSVDVDSDGSSWGVSFLERTLPYVSERIFAATLNLDEPLTCTELEQVSRDNDVCRYPAICSTRSGGGDPQRFFVVWDQPGSGGRDIAGAFYDSTGPGRAYCVGAPNTAGPGASIQGTGSRSVALNSFGLAVSGAPPGQNGIFFLGLNELQLPFGEGFRCVGDPTRRISPMVTTDGTGAASVLLDLNQHYGDLVTPGAPGVLYQFWYRDPTGGPAGFNTSNALRVQHTD